MSDIERRGHQPPRITGREIAVVPEGIDSLKRVMDQTQTVLEGAYGVNDLGLLKASGFLYPEASSKMVEHNLSVDNWNNSGFFVTDADSHEGIEQQVRRQLLRKQAFRESLGLPRNPHVDQNLGVTPSARPERTSFIPKSI